MERIPPYTLASLIEQLDRQILEDTQADLAAADSIEDGFGWIRMRLARRTYRKRAIGLESMLRDRDVLERASESIRRSSNTPSSWVRAA